MYGQYKRNAGERMVTMGVYVCCGAHTARVIRWVLSSGTEKFNE